MAEIDEEKKGTYSDPWVVTSTGAKFYLRRPVFDIEVISHALALNCRYNGHIKFPYSVAQHSVMVAEIAELLALDDGLSSYEALYHSYEGLLHDATEAYLSDIPSPFKTDLPDWRKIDATMERAVREQFGLRAEKSAYVKKADWYALFIEADQLLPGNGREFEDPVNLREEALLFGDANGYVILESEWRRDEANFQCLYEDISTELGRSAA
jgi:hypothetical protein